MKKDIKVTRNKYFLFLNILLKNKLSDLFIKYIIVFPFENTTHLLTLFFRSKHIVMLKLGYG